MKPPVDLQRKGMQLLRPASVLPAYLECMYVNRMQPGTGVRHYEEERNTIFDLTLTFVPNFHVRPGLMVCFVFLTVHVPPQQLVWRCTSHRHPPSHTGAHPLQWTGAAPPHLLRCLAQTACSIRRHLLMSWPPAKVARDRCPQAFASRTCSAVQLYS